jgi:uncharacterized membrane protein YcaP (DUF421 family)
VFAAGKYMFDVDGMKLLEIVARVSIIYIGCMILLRLAGRREMSELSPMDLLGMLLLSETVSPALTGGDESIPGGMTAAAVLILWSVGTAWMAFANRKFESVVQGDAVVVIENGRVKGDVIKKYRISPDDLENALHMHGMLHVREVKRAFVEADGEITMIKQKDYDDAQERFFSKQG